MTRPTDHSLPIRKATITKLLAAPAITAMVGQRVHGMRVLSGPEWPFIRYGAPSASPFEASGMGGSDIGITLHAFARGPDESNCAELAEAIVDALSDDTLPLAEGLGLVSLDWTGIQIIPDGEESTDYHAIIRFSVVTTAE